MPEQIGGAIRVGTQLAPGLWELYALQGAGGDVVRCFTCQRMLVFYWPAGDGPIVPVGRCEHGRPDAAAAYHAVVHLFSETIRATAAKGGKR